MSGASASTGLMMSAPASQQPWIAGTTAVSAVPPPVQASVASPSPALMFSQVHALRQSSSSTRQERRQSTARATLAAMPEAPTPQSTSAQSFRGHVSACSICLDNFSPGDHMGRLLCGHVFHCSCLGELAANNGVFAADETGDAETMLFECPCCRSQTQVARTWRYPALTEDSESNPSGEQAADAEPMQPVPASPSPRADSSTPQEEAFFTPDSASAYPWWPIADHNTQPSEGQPVYHTSVRLTNGRTGLLVDPGSYGNLVGEEWLVSACSRMQCVPKMRSRQLALQVGGVGRGSQQCKTECCLPIALQRQDGSVASGTYSAPVVSQSGCPALLGLRTLQENRAILDCDKRQLHFPAKGEITLVLPPGSETYQLETAESGHLLLPCDAFHLKTPQAVEGEHHLFAAEPLGMPSDPADAEVPAHLAEIIPSAELQHEEEMCAAALEPYSFAVCSQILAKLAQTWCASEAGARERFECHNGLSRIVGVYVHGGTVGTTKAFQQRPQLTKMLCRMVAEATEAPFSTVALLINVESPVHRDVYNCGVSTVLPVIMPRSGGGLWIELGQGDVIQGSLEVKTVGNCHVAGQVLPLKVGEPTHFDPKRRHATQSWTSGNRVILAAYTAGGSAKLSAEAVTKLQEHGFRLTGNPIKSSTGYHSRASTLVGGPETTAAAVPSPQPRIDTERSRSCSLNVPTAGSHTRAPTTLTAPEVRSYSSSRAPALSMLRRVLLVSVFHSTFLAFQDNGYEPTRLRPIELLRAGYDDVLDQVKRSAYSAVWVDLTDARQFAGQQRTSQVCSRLQVLAGLAQRQSTPFILSATGAKAWSHPAVQELVYKNNFYVSRHHWCRFGIRLSPGIQASSAYHKVMSTIPLSDHPCTCEASVVHSFDLGLNQGEPGTARLRADAERQVTSRIIATLAAAAATAASPGSSTRTDPICIVTTSTTTAQQLPSTTSSTSVSSARTVRFNLGAEAKDPECSLDPPQHLAEAQGNATSAAFPTDQKIQQREKAKALKASGVEPPPARKRKKPVEQHFDDCGEDLSSLQLPSQTNLLVESLYASDEESFPEAEGMASIANALSQWALASTLSNGQPTLHQNSVLAVDVDEMFTILGELQNRACGAEVIEVCGGSARTSYLCVRRCLSSGRNLELITGTDLAVPETQNKIIRYIASARPLVIIMSPAFVLTDRSDDRNHIFHRSVWGEGVCTSAALARFCGDLAMLQSESDRVYVMEQPYPSGIYGLEPWPKVRKHPECHRVVLHQCALGLQAGGLPCCKITELTSNSPIILSHFAGLQCPGTHQCSLPTVDNAQAARLWPPMFCSRLARGIEAAFSPSTCKSLDAFPSVTTATDSPAEAETGSEPWRKCKGCLWRLSRMDPLHSREAGVCKYPDDHPVDFKCPGCVARKNRADESHTYGPDCRHVLTKPREPAKQRRPFGRRPAHDEPTSGLKASKLGAQAEQRAEELSAPRRLVEGGSSTARSSHEPQPPDHEQASASDEPPNEQRDVGAGSAGRGPDAVPRVRRTYRDAEGQTEDVPDWSTFDVQATMRGLRHGSEADRRRLLRKLHIRWWHCSTDRMQRLLKTAGLPKEILDLVPEITDTCRVCRHWARPSPDAKPTSRLVIGFNLEIEGDLMFVRHKGKSNIILVLVCRGVRWTSATCVPDRQTSTLLMAIDSQWVSIFGAPQILLFDGETGLDDDESTTYFQLKGIVKRTAAPQQHTRIVDRKIAVLRDTLHKLGTQLQEEGLEIPFPRILGDAVLALNSLTSINGCSPYTAVLGRMPTLLPADDCIMSDGVPDISSRHTYRLREIAVQAIAEGTAKERMRRALNTQTRPAGEELEYKIGQQVDWFREPPSRDVSGWRGPGTIVDLSRIEHGRVGVRTSTDQVITCRLQDIRHSLAFLTEDLSIFFGVDDPVALQGTSAHEAQQKAQQYVDDLKPGTVLTVGHVRTSLGEWIETPQTEQHRHILQACSFIAESVFKISTVSVCQGWQEVRLLQFLLVADEHEWVASQKWQVPALEASSSASLDDNDRRSAGASSLSEPGRLSTIPEGSQEASEASHAGLPQLAAMFGDNLTTEETAWLREAYASINTEEAPAPINASSLNDLIKSTEPSNYQEADIPEWSQALQPETLSFLTQEQVLTGLAACSSEPDEHVVLDADEQGAYVAIEAYGEFAKLFEGIDRLPNADEVAELRFYETHTRKAVIDRSDDLLTKEEQVEHADAVLQAITNELQTWKGFNCFERRARSQSPCVIDAKWVLKWKWIKGERCIRARLCLRGFRETGADDQSNYAATASRFSQRLLVSECALRGWTLASSDVPKAFLQGVSYEELAQTTQQPLRDVSFELGGEGLACLKQMQGFTDFDARSEVLHCLKPGTGCRDAPRCFSLKLRQVTEAYGLQPSSIDSQLELLFEAGVLIMMILKHVDDLKMAGKRKVIEDFVRHVSQTFGKMDVEWQDFTFCGVHHQQHADGSISLDQIKFLSACKPIAQQAAFAGGPTATLPEDARRHFLSLLMTIAYALLTRPDVAVFVSALQRESHKAQVIHVRRLNQLLDWLQKNPRKITYPSMAYPDALLQVSDSSYKARAEDGLSVRGLVSLRVSLSCVTDGKKQVPCHLLDFASKQQRHVTRSTFSSELFAATDATDCGLLHTLAIHELSSGVLTADAARKIIEGQAECSVALALAVDARSVTSAIDYLGNTSVSCSQTNIDPNGLMIPQDFKCECPDPAIVPTGYMKTGGRVSGRPGKVFGLTVGREEETGNSWQCTDAYIGQVSHTCSTRADCTLDVHLSGCDELLPCESLESNCLYDASNCTDVMPGDTCDIFCESPYVGTMPPTLTATVGLCPAGNIEPNRSLIWAAPICNHTVCPTPATSHTGFVLTTQWTCDTGYGGTAVESCPINLQNNCSSETQLTGCLPVVGCVKPSADECVYDTSDCDNIGPGEVCVLRCTTNYDGTPTGGICLASNTNPNRLVEWQRPRCRMVCPDPVPMPRGYIRENVTNNLQLSIGLLAPDLRHMGEGSKKRGQMSAEAATIRDAKDRRQRAAKLNYPSVADRFDKDDQFKTRMMQEGRNMEDMQKFDYLSFAILPDPGRSEEQRHLRAGSHYTSDYGQATGVTPAKLVFYAHCEVEPLRTLRLIDDVSDVPIGLCYMGTFLNPRLYCEIAGVNSNARKILTFDGEVTINSNNADDIAAELAQILIDSMASAERQLASTERLVEQNRQVAARHNPVPKGAARPKAEPLYRGYTQAEWDEYNRSRRRGQYSQAEWDAWNRSRRY
eukprot:s2270_g8.t1